MRNRLADPHKGDDMNCLVCFTGSSAVDFWSVDMRLTLLWCLAYEARFRRRGPALELWLAIIEGTRERVDWSMWEDGDETWIRNMIIQHRMTHRFRAPTLKLSSADWMLALDALERRLDRPTSPSPFETWSTEQRVLRIAWCAVSDGVPVAGTPQYLDLTRPIDWWSYYTCPFRSSYDQDMKLRLHDQPQCSFSSCKVGVWQWFKTAIMDYDLAEIPDVMGCCDGCISAFSAIPGFQPRMTEVPNLQFGPHPLGRFRIQTGDSSSPLKPKASSWIDSYPSSWRKYLILPDSNDWAKLEALTHESSRPPSASSEYDSIIRIGTVVLWASSNSIPDSRGIEILRSLESSCRAPQILTITDFCGLNLGPEIVDWKHPQTWLDHNREQLRSSVLNDPDALSLANVVENVYMVYHVARALPLRFMSSVFACLLRKFRRNEHLDQFRSWIDIWKTWDTNTCLINFRLVLATTFEFSKLIEEPDLPMSLINVVIHTDIRCICAQFAGILSDPVTYKDFLKTRNDDAQKLLDLLQDLLDYPLLDSRVRPVILKALLKLSTRSGRHPRCFALSDRLRLDDIPAAAGSFGDVWKDGSTGKQSPQARLCVFYREALIWRQLSHPNLLPFFGAYYLEGSKSQLCLVSPWMENGNALGVNRLSLVLDIALGLDQLHALKLVHGDLKAINVLITGSGRAVLADFGLSSVTDSNLLLSTSNVNAAGTMRGSHNSFASDVYAFAYLPTSPVSRALRGRAVMWKVMHGERPQRSPSIPDEIWNLMQDCWKEDPQSVCPLNRYFRLGPLVYRQISFLLGEHTLFLSCGEIDDWLQFTRSGNSHEIRSSGPIFSARSAIYLAGPEADRLICGLIPSRH
ncbi:hypothetical protein K438DRAFT_1857495 [Mycena galopus ATCC 62051]|nr:hypothetical protein K438DRAFT_1857495 [Mycena galopus ATCC 62051]